jgi:carbon-monoxide dehydrogenase small subunit
MRSSPEITEIPVKLTVNGQSRALVVEPRHSLAEVLRRKFGSTGTRIGCELGVCGTCTVLVDGDPVRACLMLAVQADDTEVETVESLAENGKPNALQRAFSDKHGVQCGFCTPGFLMLATALLREQPAADRQRIRECVSANLCRCTGYTGIVDAIESVVRPSGSHL